MRVVIVVALGWFWLVNGVRADDAAAPFTSADPETVIASLQHAVSGEGWNIHVATLTSNDLRKRFREPTRVRRAAVLEASQPTGSRGLAILVMDHESPAHARAFIEARRALLRKALPEGPGIQCVENSAGGGRDSRHPGFFMRFKIAANNATILSDMHAVSFGALSITMDATDLTAFSRARQDAYIAYAIARLKQPAGAHKPPPPIKATGKTRQVLVTIVDAFGDPVPSAEVYLEHPRFGIQATSRCVNGICTVLAPLDEITVTVVKPQRADNQPLNLAPADVVLKPDVWNLRVQMSAGHTIKGRLLDDLGKPLGDAQVGASYIGNESLSIRLGQQAFRTNATGHFELVGLRKGSYVLGAERGDVRIALKRMDPVATGAMAVELRALVRATVTLRVEDPDGMPVPGVRIWARAFDNGLPPGELFDGNHIATSDERGSATLEISRPDKPQTITMLPPSSRPLLARTVRRINPSNPGQTVTLDAGWTLNLRVVDKAGQPVAARVVIQKSSHQETKRTDAVGHLTLRHLPNRPVHLFASAPNDAKTTADAPLEAIAPSDGPVTVIAHQRKVLQVAVHDPEGNALARADITVQQGNQSWAHSNVVLPLAVARLEGTFVVAASNPRDAKQNRLNFAPARAVIQDDTRAAVTLTLTPGARVSGRVIDAVGKPVPGITVAILPQRSSVPGDDAITKTDANGRYAFMARAGMAYWINASDKYRRVQGSVVLVIGAPASLDLELKPR